MSRGYSLVSVMANLVDENQSLLFLLWVLSLAGDHLFQFPIIILSFLDGVSSFDEESSVGMVQNTASIVA